MLKLSLALVFVVVVSAPAYAEQLIGKPNGLLCRDPKALADLTLPDGSSRAASQGATDAQRNEAAAGSCQDSGGTLVDLVTRRRNTSIVTWPGGPRGGGPWYVPNSDFVTRPADCIADNARVSLSGKIELRHMDADPDLPSPAYDYPRLHLNRPICFLGSNLAIAAGAYVSLPATTEANAQSVSKQVGRLVTVTGNLSNPDNGNQPPDDMMMFDPILGPSMTDKVKGR